VYPGKIRGVAMVSSSRAAQRALETGICTAILLMREHLGNISMHKGVSRV